MGVSNNAAMITKLYRRPGHPHTGSQNSYMHC